MGMIRMSRLLGMALLLGVGATELEAAAVMQVTRGVVQDATRQQAVAGGSAHLLQRIEAIQALLDRCLSMGPDAVCQAVRSNADKRHEGVRRGQLAEVESIVREDIARLRETRTAGTRERLEIRAQVLVLEEELLEALMREVRQDETSRPVVRRQVYETTVETVVDGRVVRIPARVEQTTVAAERAHCAPESDLVVCRVEGRVDPDLFCWGSGAQRACPRGSGGSLTPQTRPQAAGRGEPIEVLSFSWGRAFVDPDDDEVSLEYAWFVSGGGPSIDLISALEPGAIAARRGDEGRPMESLSLNFTKIEPAGVGTPPDGEGSLRVPLHRVEPGLQLVRVALHRRDLPLCGVTDHFLFGGDCDDTDPVVRPGIRGGGEGMRPPAGGLRIPGGERR